MQYQTWDLMLRGFESFIQPCNLLCFGKIILRAKEVVIVSILLIFLFYYGGFEILKWFYKEN
jgi:hypothetical protein